jgi:hypothetical protein
MAKVVKVDTVPDGNTFALEWALVSLIETAPGGPLIVERPSDAASPWLRLLWDRAQAARESDSAERERRDDEALERAVRVTGGPQGRRRHGH